MTRPAPEDAVQTMLVRAVDNSLALLGEIAPDAAAGLQRVWRRDVTSPSIVVAGAAGQGKSSLTNMLIGVPNLSPVGPAATPSPLEFRYSTTVGARAHLPDREHPVPLSRGYVRDWWKMLQRLPDGMRPPRLIEVHHHAPLLRHLTLVDTPGFGGPDPVRSESAVEAVDRGTALLCVVDASSPFTTQELLFLIEVGKRLSLVVFALTKCDAFPRWPTVLADNRNLLRANAPWLGTAPCSRFRPARPSGRCR